MKEKPRGNPSSAYEIVFVGNLDNAWCQWFEGWDLKKKAMEPRF